MNSFIKMNQPASGNVHESCVFLIIFSAFMIVLSDVAIVSKTFFKRLLKASLWLLIANVVVDLITDRNVVYNIRMGLATFIYNLLM